MGDQGTRRETGLKLSYVTDGARVVARSTFSLEGKLTADYYVTKPVKYILTEYDPKEFIAERSFGNKTHNQFVCGSGDTAEEACAMFARYVGYLAEDVLSKPDEKLGICSLNSKNELKEIISEIDLSHKSRISGVLYNLLPEASYALTRSIPVEIIRFTGGTYCCEAYFGDKDPYNLRVCGRGTSSEAAKEDFKDRLSALAEQLLNPSAPGKSSLPRKKLTQAQKLIYSAARNTIKTIVKKM